MTARSSKSYWRLDWRSAALVCTIAVAVSSTSYARQTQEATVVTAVSTGPPRSQAPPSVRRRLQQLRGVTPRVIYPIIFVVGGDSTRAFELMPSLGAADVAVTEIPPGAVPDSLVQIARLTGVPLDSLVAGLPGIPGIGDPDGRAIAEDVQPVGAGQARPQGGQVGNAARDAALNAEMQRLRAEILRLNNDADVSRAAQAAQIIALNQRLTELERDVDLLLAVRGQAQTGGRDTLVVVTRDTITQRIEVAPRVDTVFVREPAGPPTVVEIERALLDEGLFQTVDVLFEFNKSTLLPASERVLASVGKVLRDHPEIEVEIGGHTDSVGPEEYNQTLSVRRADAVRTYLLSNEGIAPERISARGFGESRPVANNQSPTGRALNRRVDFRVTGSE